MSVRRKIRQALDALGMVEGLAGPEVCRRLRQANRTTELGWRATAFYLVEMVENDHYVAAGYPSLADFAECELSLSERRTFELLKVGRALRDLRKLEAAFCRRGLPWSKVVEICRIATPETESDWIRFAGKNTVKQLRLEIAGRRKGDSPLEAKHGKQTEEIRLRTVFRSTAEGRALLEAAQQKLGDERGTAATVDEVIEEALALFLALERDGKVEGWTRVDSSLYRIHLYPAFEEEDAPLMVRTDDGLIPLGGRKEDGLIASQRQACARCDGEHVGPTGEKIDPPTPPAKRKRTVTRDGHRCRCCGRRGRLHVHHITLRSRGGPTRVWNLITVCVRCHSLLHAGLLVIRGKTQKKAVFCDRNGRPVHRPGAHADPKDLLRLELPVRRGERASLEPGKAVTGTRATLDDVPEEVDGAWWARNAERIRTSPRGLELRTGALAPEAAPPEPTPGGEETRQDTAGAPASEGTERAAALERVRRGVDAREAAFGGLVGRDALIERLKITARGARKLGRAYPHTLFLGPPGVGKTTLAKGVAACVGARLVRASGPLVTDEAMLVRLLASLEQDDVFFVDEVHAVPSAVLEVLYQAMDEGRLSLTLHQGVRERGIALKLPRFTLLAATTEPQRLPEPLRTRFQRVEELDRPGEAAMAELVTLRALAAGFDLSSRAAARLAALSRGTPREALRLLDALLVAAAGRDATRIDLALVEAESAALGFDPEGLKPPERRCLDALGRAGGPVSRERLVHLAQVDPRLFAVEIEPELERRGLIRVTPNGRTLGRGARPRNGKTRHFKPSAGLRTSAVEGSVEEDSNL